MELVPCWSKQSMTSAKNISYLFEEKNKYMIWYLWNMKLCRTLITWLQLLSLIQSKEENFTMRTSVKHIATLCIILVFSHCTKSLRCYECADKGDSALDCFPAFWKELLLTKIPPNLSSCEKQRSVSCNGFCNNFTLSGCGKNDLRRYSEFKIRILIR